MNSVRKSQKDIEKINQMKANLQIQINLDRKLSNKVPVENVNSGLNDNELNDDFIREREQLQFNVNLLFPKRKDEANKLMNMIISSSEVDDFNANFPQIKSEVIKQYSTKSLTADMVHYIFRTIISNRAENNPDFVSNATQTTEKLKQILKILQQFQGQYSNGKSTNNNSVDGGDDDEYNGDFTDEGFYDTEGGEDMQYDKSTPKGNNSSSSGNTDRVLSEMTLKFDALNQVLNNEPLSTQMVVFKRLGGQEALNIDLSHILYALNAVRNNPQNYSHFEETLNNINRSNLLTTISRNFFNTTLMLKNEPENEPDEEQEGEEGDEGNEDEEPEEEYEPQNINQTYYEFMMEKYENGTLQDNEIRPFIKYLRQYFPHIKQPRNGMKLPELKQYLDDILELIKNENVPELERNSLAVYKEKTKHYYNDAVYNPETYNDKNKALNFLYFLCYELKLHKPSSRLTLPVINSKINEILLKHHSTLKEKFN